MTDNKPETENQNADQRHTASEGEPMDTSNEPATRPAPRTVMEVEMEPTEQGIVVFDGTGSPLHLIDSMNPADVAEMLGTLVSRRVLVARLWAWADSIESLGDTA